MSTTQRHRDVGVFSNSIRLKPGTNTILYYNLPNRLEILFRNNIELQFGVLFAFFLFSLIVFSLVISPHLCHHAWRDFGQAKPGTTAIKPPSGG